MTPKERAKAALERRIPEDIVPTMEIEFQKHKELVGQNLILGQEFAKCTGRERQKAIEHNVDIYCREAELLDYSSITIDPLYWEFGHGIGTKFYYPTLEDQIDVTRALYREIGDRVFLAVSMDATYGIPLTENFDEFVIQMFEDEELLLENAEKELQSTLENAKRLVDAGIGVIYSCSDYCFGTSSFYSHDMFAKYIHPFLKRQIQEFKKMGAYTIKHTDGNLNTIIDLLLDCEPHAIHSIDPMAGMDIADFKKNYGNRVCIMGNVNTSKLESGSAEEIELSARYALDNAMPGGGYIFSTCNTVYEAMPLNSYQLMLDIRKRFGRYDITR